MGSPAVKVMIDAVAASMAARAELTLCLDTSNVVCFHFTDPCNKILQGALYTIQDRYVISLQNEVIYQFYKQAILEQLLEQKTLQYSIIYVLAM